MRLAMLIVLCLLASSRVSGHVHCPKAECEETKQKIRLVQSKMRQGYTRAQGERLEAELRRLRAIRARKCR